MTAARSRADIDAPASAHGEHAAVFARLVAEGRFAPQLGVTCRGRGDGAGQQAMAVISAMMLARFAGCRYLHSPFARMHHAEGTPEDWARQWEAFFNFDDGETSVPADAELVQLAAAIERPDTYAGRPIVVFRPLFNLPGEAAQIGEGLRGELRRKYWRSSKATIPSHCSVAGFTAAIHLRRGDVTLIASGHRFVRDDTMLRHIARLRRAVAPLGRPLTLNLYSEGDTADFGAFADAGCNLHISEDPFETLHNMVTADILLSAPSNFSYIAALLSQGIVLDHRRRAPPSSNFQRRRADANISIKQLRRALLSRMGWMDRCAYRVRRHLLLNAR